MQARLLPFLLLLPVLAACDTSPIDWKDPVVLARPNTPVRLVVDTSGRVRYVADSSRVTLPTGVACARSLETAPAATRTFAAWWAARKDSSVNLFVAWSTDSGKTWTPPMSVDTSDVSSTGCNRPPPALTTVGDDVYVAYSMIASEGTGVFFAHTMGSMLHSPVAVIYGERLVLTAIAAHGDSVAVAYEEPNGSRQQVDVALSTTQGHIFEIHTVASRDVDVAAAPSVALDGRTIAVGWTEKRDGQSIGAVVRVGKLR